MFKMQLRGVSGTPPSSISLEAHVSFIQKISGYMMLGMNETPRSTHVQAQPLCCSTL